MSNVFSVTPVAERRSSGDQQMNERQQRIWDQVYGGWFLYRMANLSEVSLIMQGTPPDEFASREARYVADAAIKNLPDSSDATLGENR